MENTEIAGIFHDIADLLEVKGENPFRVRSYRNAGDVVEGLPVTLKSILEGGGEKGLEAVPGIGKSIREKVVEILKTGKCHFLDELLKEVPPGVLDILKVSGVGPKKAAVMYRELGISSVDELEEAAGSGGLRGLPGFGQKTEEKILKAIKGLKAFSGRFRLSLARPYSENIVEHLKKVPGTGEVVPAGSMRRWRDSVGDLDILATCKEPGRIMDAFTTHPDVREIVSRGETKSTVILSSGLQVDLRVLDKGSFGAALQYFTGSKAHNVAIRDRAKRMGLKVSEYGVFREKDGRKLAGAKEEDVYKCVGLPWIPPELRENRGEIAAAEKGGLPRALELKDIRGDLHSHTTESDGGNTLEEMAEAAMRMGYEYLAVTDHSKAVGVAHGLDEKRVLKQIKEIEAFNEKLRKGGKRFRLLKGTEVDIKADGTLDHPDGLLEKLDCVVGAVHSSFNLSEREMTARIVKAIASGRLNVIAHPTGRLIGMREPYQLDMEAVAGEAKRHGVALELNSYPERLDLNDVHCKLARDTGVLVSVATDSHSIYNLNNISYGIHTARRGWLEKKNVLNTRPLKELMKVLNKEGG